MNFCERILEIAHLSFKIISMKNLFSFVTSKKGGFKRSSGFLGIRLYFLIDGNGTYNYFNDDFLF